MRKQKIRNNIDRIIAIIVITIFLTDSLIARNIIKPDNLKFNYTGRIDFTEKNAPKLFWPGTYIDASFTGTSVKILFDDLRGENYYNIFIDGNFSDPVIIDCDSGFFVYPIVKDLKDTIHTIKIFRRTEGFSGRTIFQGLLLDDEGKLVDSKPKPKRIIEFYGNSITCGMGNECDEDSGDTDNSKRNNFLTYGAMTARNLDAQYICIAKSGIGIIKSWFDMVMPEYYNRLDPSNPDIDWDFSKWTPDIVVVNLFQNDSWLVPKMELVPTEEQIIQSYINFISTLRLHYPDAHIFCTLGCMDATKDDSPWPEYIKSAVEKMNDNKMYYHFFKSDGFYKHPRVRHHKKMADSLTEFIKLKVMN